MYGQYRSKVICSKCDYKSVQFDPFGMCSIPIPDENYRLFITFQDDINLS
jgi:ubiquitin C-terminal hydrolase